jgi:16S rRNA (guanine527-N7)-methyltransferase
MEGLIQEARHLFGIQLDRRQATALNIFEHELLAWNEKLNLTAIRDPEAIRTKHFLDSFSCVMAWNGNPPLSLVDVGCGAGFPGLVLKILYPGMHLTLVESVGKKTKFCCSMVDALKLDGVVILNARAEQVGQDSLHRARYDWAVGRAVADLPVLAEYLLPLVRVGGSTLAMKGVGGPAEAQRAEKALAMLGGNLRQIIPITLPGVAEERCLVVIDKVKATPSAYPRRPGIPTKRPLA